MTSKVEVSIFQLCRDRLEDLLTADSPTDSTTTTCTTGNGSTPVSRASLVVTAVEDSAGGLVSVEGASAMVMSSASDFMRIYGLASCNRVALSRQSVVSSTASATRSHSESVTGSESRVATSSESHLVVFFVVTQTNRRSG